MNDYFFVKAYYKIGFILLGQEMSQILMGRGSNNRFETQKILMGKGAERGKCRLLRILVV